MQALLLTFHALVVHVHMPGPLRTRLAELDDNDREIMEYVFQSRWYHRRDFLANAETDDIEEKLLQSLVGMYMLVISGRGESRHIGIAIDRVLGFARDMRIEHPIDEVVQNAPRLETMSPEPPADAYERVKILEELWHAHSEELLKTAAGTQALHAMSRDLAPRCLNLGVRESQRYIDRRVQAAKTAA